MIGESLPLLLALHITPDFRSAIDLCVSWTPVRVF